MDTLPIDIINEIGSYCDYLTFKSFRCTCKYLFKNINISLYNEKILLKYNNLQTFLLGIYFEDTDLLKLMIDSSDFKINCYDRSIHKLFDLLLEKKLSEICDLLLYKIYESKSYSEMIMIRLAGQLGNLGMIKLLFPEDNFDNTTRSVPLLHYACMYNHIDIVKRMLVKDASLLIYTFDGEYMLETAAKYGHIDIIKFLFEYEYGCNDENEFDHENEFNHEIIGGFLEACRNKHLEIVKLFIDKCMNIIKDKIPSALKEAVENDNYQIVSLLINIQSSSYEIDLYGNIELAIQKGHFNSLKILINPENKQVVNIPSLILLSLLHKQIKIFHYLNSLLN